MATGERDRTIGQRHSGAPREPQSDDQEADGENELSDPGRDPRTDRRASVPFELDEFPRAEGEDEGQARQFAWLTQLML